VAVCGAAAIVMFAMLPDNFATEMLFAKDLV
jgi:hypothetical protein